MSCHYLTHFSAVCPHFLLSYVAVLWPCHLSKIYPNRAYTVIPQGGFAHLSRGVAESQFFLTSQLSHASGLGLLKIWGGVHGGGGGTYVPSLNFKTHCFMY